MLRSSEFSSFSLYPSISLVCSHSVTPTCFISGLFLPQRWQTTTPATEKRRRPVWPLLPAPPPPVGREQRDPRPKCVKESPQKCFLLSWALATGQNNAGDGELRAQERRWRPTSGWTTAVHRRARRRRLTGGTMRERKRSRRRKRSDLSLSCAALKMLTGAWPLTLPP